MGTELDLSGEDCMKDFLWSPWAACLILYSLGYFNWWAVSRCHLKKCFFVLISFLYPRFLGAISIVSLPCDCPKWREIAFITFPKLLEPCLPSWSKMLWNALGNTNLSTVRLVMGTQKYSPFPLWNQLKNRATRNKLTYEFFQLMSHGQ